MEHFCKGGVVVQNKKAQRRTGKRAKRTGKKAAPPTVHVAPTEVCRFYHTYSVQLKHVIFLLAFAFSQEELHNRWATSAGQISAILTADADDSRNGVVLLPEHERPVPYDAVAEQSMADQK